MGAAKPFHRRLWLDIVLVWTFLNAFPLMAATNVKLSGTMPDFGDVEEFQISPDGRYAVYLADQETDGVSELYSVFLDGGSPVRLNPLFPTGRNVYHFLISPDSTRVVYSADQDTDMIAEVYSVPIGGPPSAGIKISSVEVVNSGSQNQISPDSKWVIYLGYHANGSDNELYSVPITSPNSAGIKLNKTFTVDGLEVLSFQISPDSTRVVYRADQDPFSSNGLYSVPIEGPAEAGTSLNIPLDLFKNVIDFQISPDGSHVIYKADQDSDEIYELYGVPIIGPADVGIKLSGDMAAGGDAQSFQVSPNNLRVVYLADQDSNDVKELYSVPIGGPGSAGTKLNGALAFGGNVEGFRFTPDSSRVIYIADQQTDQVFGVYSVPIEGPGADGFKLRKPGVGVYTFNISPDGTRVVYVADKLYSVPTGGPAMDGIDINKTLVDGGSVLSFQITSDNKWVVYLADQDKDTIYELYGVPVTGPKSAGIKLSGTMVDNGSVKIISQDNYMYEVSSDGGRVLYVADQDKDEVFELYMTSFDDIPDPFTFMDQTGVTLNTVVISNMITIQGINTETSISITGGEYSLNGGTYTSSPGTANCGDSVTIHLISSSHFSTTTEATLTIGGISDNFTVTTMGLINLYLPLIFN